MTSTSNPLTGQVEALAFDVFGTVLDWLGPVSREIQRRAASSNVSISEQDAVDFAKEWREGYHNTAARLSVAPHSDGPGPWNVDILHRELLEEMLSTERWKSLSDAWGPKQREELAWIWHYLDGWPDSSKGLYALKKKLILATCSHGTIRCLVDQAKYADLPWDLVYSSELVSAYKPNPKVYLTLAKYLVLEPSKIALVAAHVDDLRGAAKCGMRTIYVKRGTEDHGDGTAEKADYEEGEFDIVVDSLVELAERFGIQV